MTHPTQTSFVRERSILDNVYTFLEFVVVATNSKQKLAIVMLVFEKAYDLVDRDILQGALARLGMEY